MRNRILRSAAIWAAFACVNLAWVSRPATAGDDDVRLKLDGELQPFLGNARCDKQPIFDGERFPNLVVAQDGSVLAIWGSKRVRVRRSEDGGSTWGEEIVIADPGFHGGGATVDETTGDVLVFVEDHHPPAPLRIYRSRDHGRTWKAQEGVVIRPDSKGNVPSMHMNEHGITLRYGEYAGRLLRPTRWYAGGNRRDQWPKHYANAIYSDDHGNTWQTSEPFPANGTGEAALAELSDGRVYYNSRRHLSTDGLNPRRRHIAWSDDGGRTWKDMSVSDVLPDGDQNRDYGLMAGLVRLPVAGRDILVLSNIESPEGRHHGTVWASFDGGRTWPIKRLVEEGSFAYSSLAAGRPGTASEGWIYLLYEGSGGAQMARFNLAWLLAGQSTGDGDVPEELTTSLPAFLRPPQVITDPGSEYAGATRRFQGIPSLARSRKGRLWAIWYGGKTPGEDHNNYVMLVTSGDDGRTWSQEQVVIDPDGEGPVRTFDPELWLDPTGRMWAFWAQAVGHDASIGGVWAITSDNPDDEDARWSAPRRLTDGVMMCKPTVLSTGEWCLPASTWRQTDHSARIIVSTDGGRTWQVRGGCNIPKDVRAFDEHIIIERKDGSLWLLARTRYGIGESVSADRGVTWTELEPSSIAHPSARFFVTRLRSGNLLLVKHGPLDKQTGRSHLTAFVSKDDGRSWTGGLLLDDRSGVSYPDGVEAHDGTIYLIYDFDRRGAREILMAVFTEQDVLAGKPSETARLRVLVNKAVAH